MIRRKLRVGFLLVTLIVCIPIAWLFLSNQLSQKPLILRGHSSTVTALKFSPDDKYLASGGHDGTVRLWDPVTGAQLRTFAGPIRSPWHLAFSPDGSKLADGDLNSNIILWDVSTGGLIKTLPGHIGEVTGIEFSPNGKLLATASHEKVATIWDVEKGKPIKQFWKHKNWVVPVAFSPDGSKLATGDYECIQTWDVATGRRLSNTPNPLNHWFRYSADGTRLVTGGTYSKIKVWDTATWQMTLNLSDRVDCMDLSKSGMLITGANAPAVTVKIRDSRTGELKRTVVTSEGHASWPALIERMLPLLTPTQPPNVSRVAISPDGRMAAVASSDLIVRIWKLK